MGPPPAPPALPTGADPAPLPPAAAPGAIAIADGLGSTGWATRLDINGVRAAEPPIPGSDAARTNPAPELAPEPPANGWLDIGLAPIRPICAPLSAPKLLPIWLKICVTCWSGWLIC